MSEKRVYISEQDLELARLQGYAEGYAQGVKDVLEAQSRKGGAEAEKPSIPWNPRSPSAFPILPQEMQPQNPFDSPVTMYGCRPPFDRSVGYEKKDGLT